MNTYIVKIRKILRIFALTVFISLASILVLLSILFLVLRFDFAENYIREMGQEYINTELSAYALNVDIEKLELALPFSVQVQGLDLNDVSGKFAHIENLVLSSRFFSLLRYQVVVPDIGLSNAKLSRIPHIIFPNPPEPILEEDSGENAFPQVDQILTNLADLLFHPNVPTIVFNKIHASDVIIEPHVLTELSTLYGKQNKSADFIEKNTEFLESLRVSFIANASLDKALFRIASELELKLGADVPVTMDASFDIFKSQSVRSRIRYNDENGTLLNLFKKIISLPISQKAHVSFHMEGVGSFDDFSMKYKMGAFDDVYMNDTSTLVGDIGIVPLYATTDIQLFPKMKDVLEKGDVKLSAEARILKLEKSVKRADGQKISEIDLRKLASQARNVHVKYDFSADSMEFVNQDLKDLFGEKQKSKGELDFVFSKNQYPYIKSDNIYFESKNITAKTNLFFSHNVDMSAEASIRDLSALSSNVQNVSGQASGKISVTGDVNNLFWLARFEVPSLKIELIQNSEETKPKEIETEQIKTEEIKPAEIKAGGTRTPKGNENPPLEDTVEKQNFTLKSFVFEVKSKEQDSNIEQRRALIAQIKHGEENTILGNTETLHAPQASNGQSSKETSEKLSHSLDEGEKGKKVPTAYELQVNNLFRLFYQNKRTPSPFLVNMTANYNDNPVNFYSQVRLSPELLGVNSGKSRDFEIKDILFQGLGAKIKGDMLASWDASSLYSVDLKSMPLLRGNLDASLQNGDVLGKALGLALGADNALLKWNFSVVPNPKQTQEKNTTPVKADKADKTNKVDTADTTNNSGENKIASQNNSLPKVYSGSQEMNLHFSAMGLTYDAYSIKNNSMNLSVKNMWLKPQIKTSLRIENLDLNSNKSKDFRFDAHGSLLDLKMKTSMQGDVSAFFEGVIGIDRSRKDIFLDMYKLEIKHAATKTDIRLKQKGQLRLSDEEFLANKIHVMIAPRGEAQLNGVLRAEHVALDGWWKNIDLQYLPFGYDGDLHGRFKFRGTSKKPSGTVDIGFRDLKGEGYPPISLNLNGAIIAGQNLHKLALGLTIIDKNTTVKGAEIKLQIPMESEPRLRIAKDLPLEGSVKYNGAIETLWQYLPLDGRKLIGHLFVDGKVYGTIQEPFVELEADLENARYEDIILGILLTKMNAKFHLAPYGQGTLMFSASDNATGSMNVKGDIIVPWLSYGRYEAPVKIAGELPTARERNAIKLWEKSIAVLDLTSSIQSFQPLQRNDVYLTLSGDLAINGMLVDPSVTGVFKVDKGEVNLSNIQSTSSIPTLNIVDEITRKRKARQANTGSLDISLLIAKNFYVLGPGIDTQWKGNLKIEGKTSSPSVSGKIQAVEGRMSLLGKKFSLVKGDAIFDGSMPIVPILDIQLGYQAQEINAKIELTGTVNSPQLGLTSTPYLPEDEILARILFFSSVSELSAYEKIRLATTIASLAGFNLTSGITNIGTKLFGLDVIRINSDDSNATGADANADADAENISVELGKYLTKKIYLGVEQGVIEQETVGITNIEINNNLSFGAKAGTEESEVNFEWRLDY